MLVARWVLCSLAFGPREILLLAAVSTFKLVSVLIPPQQYVVTQSCIHVMLVKAQVTECPSNPSHTYNRMSHCCPHGRARPQPHQGQKRSISDDQSHKSNDALRRKLTHCANQPLAETSGQTARCIQHYAAAAKAHPFVKKVATRPTALCP